MKKILTLIVISFMFISNEIIAQNLKYYTTDFSVKIKYDDGSWSNWSDWEDSHCLVNINLDREEINIYSSTPQEFTIYKYEEGSIYDNDGGEQIKLFCVDKDGLRCTIRLRIYENTLQLYVDYNDVVYVYNLIEK